MISPEFEPDREMKPESKSENTDNLFDNSENVPVELNLSSLDQDDQLSDAEEQDCDASACETLYYKTVSLMESGELDLENGIMLLQKSSHDGCALSGLYLGDLYSDPDSENYNPALAFDNYAISAKLGDPIGCYKTGICLSSGFGCEKNDENSFRVFSLGAETGSPECICALGICYEFGVGCDIDYETAVSFYRQSADMNCAMAINNLGGCYFYGHGIEQDKEKAIELFARASELGDSNAQCRLGSCYENGDGCLPDAELAFSYYKKAAADKNPVALFRLALCYDRGSGVQQNFAQSFKYYTRAAKAGHAEAMYEAGKMSMSGRGTKKDPESAYKMFSSAAESGLAAAEYEVGNCFFEGIGTVRNQAYAYRHYKKAFETQGAAADAAFRLGLCKLKGLGTEKNEEAAYEWFCRGAESGSVEAMYMKGECLTYGVGVEKDLENAAESYAQAIKTGENASERLVPAMLSMAICYENGIGIHKNSEKALALYKRASEYGNADAMYRAGRTIMSSVEMKTEYSVARIYILRAARKGHLPAMLLMGIFADEGRGIPQNRDDAKRWYTKAVSTETNVSPSLFDFPERFSENARLALESKIEAQYKLGMLTARHNRSSQSYIQAFELIAAAAAMGHEGAQTEISKIYVSGGDLKGYYESPFSREDASFANGDVHPDKQTLAAAMNKLGDALFDGKAMVKKNEGFAARCYKISAVLGHIDACYSYGWCLRHGVGVRENDSEAVKWLKMSADMGNPNAAYSYGLCCEEGAGTGIKNRRDALSYYRKAAAAGHVEAAQRYVTLSERDE